MFLRTKVDEGILTRGGIVCAEENLIQKRTKWLNRTFF